MIKYIKNIVNWTSFFTVGFFRTVTALNYESIWGLQKGFQDISVLKIYSATYFSMIVCPLGNADVNAG